LMLPLSIVLTPPTFLGDWLVRSLFIMDDVEAVENRG